MTTEEIMMSFPITRKAWKQAGLIWSGIAIPCDKSTVDGGTIRSEKVLKFNRKAMKELNKATVEKVAPARGTIRGRSRHRKSHRWRHGWS